MGEKKSRQKNNESRLKIKCEKKLLIRKQINYTPNFECLAISINSNILLEKKFID